MKSKILYSILIIIILGYTITISNNYSIASILNWNLINKKIKGNKKIIQIDRQVESYDKIKLLGLADVQFTDGAEGNLKLEGEENILEHLITEVINNELIIRFKNNIDISYAKDLIVYVPIEKISEIKSSGTGDIHSKINLNVDNLKINLEGAGDINLKDLTTNELDVELDGTGDISISGNTACNTSNILLNGTGDINLKELITNELDIELDGTGDISIKGNTSSKTSNIILNGSGDIDIEKIETENSIIKLEGTGDIEITGNCNDMNATILGIGTIDCRNFNAKISHLKLKGIGNLYSHTSQTANISNEGMGKIYVSGKPKIIKN